MDGYKVDSTSKNNFIQSVHQSLIGTDRGIDSLTQRSRLVHYSCPKCPNQKIQKLIFYSIRHLYKGKKLSGLPTAQLALGNRSDPRYAHIDSNGHNTDYPKNFRVVDVAVAGNEQEDDATEVTCRACDAGDETCDGISQLVIFQQVHSRVGDCMAHCLPLDVGCTCGTSEKHAPLPASSKNARPVMRPIIIPF